MANFWKLIVLVLLWSLFGDDGAVKAQILQPFSPHAAQQYVSDSEKADRGDAEAAYRLGEALESGRLGGATNINKALMFYKLAAQNGHQAAAARVAQIEAKIGQGRTK